MGDLEGWTGILADKECTTSANPLPSAIYIEVEQWAKAELRTAELISRIQPTVISEYRRKAVVQYVQHLIHQCIGCEVFTFGSVPLKTYLPDGDIDLSAFSKNQNVKNTWANEVRSALEEEERNKDAEFRVKEVQYIHAEVKLVKCLIENIVVDISFNQLGGLCTLCFLEQVDQLIGKNHLFKRSIILVKAWCYYESRILGAHHGLISTYALETLVLYIFHLFHASLRGPLEVLYRFLDYFSKFDWDNYCVSIQGPVPISALPEIVAESPQTDGSKVLLSKEFLRMCTDMYSVFPKGQDSQSRSFSSKYLNVVDPLRENNNLGRSVSKGNFYRIRSAFGYGARKLGKILQSPEENIAEELDNFFLNTWDRHGNGLRPDVPDSISCGLESKLSGESASFMALSKSIVENGKQDSKDIPSCKGSKAQSTECIGQFKILTYESDRLQNLLISSPVESISPITEANGANLKNNLSVQIKKVEASSVDIGPKVTGDLTAGKETGQHSESHMFSNLQPNQSSRSSSAFPREGHPVSGGRLAGDAKDLASDNHAVPDLSRRESSDPSSKQRSLTGGNNCWLSANHRGKSISSSVSINSKRHVSPPIAKKELMVEGNTNEEIAGSIACSEATISSHSNIPVKSDGENCQFASNIKQECGRNNNVINQENFDASEKAAMSKTFKASLSSSYVHDSLPLLQYSQMSSCLPVSVGSSLSGPVLNTGPPSVLKPPLRNIGSSLLDPGTSSGFVARDTKFVGPRGPMSPPLPHCQLPLSLCNVGLVDKATGNSLSFQSQLGTNNRQQQHNEHWPDQQNLPNVMNFSPAAISTSVVPAIVQPLSAGSVISASPFSCHTYCTQTASAQMLNFSSSNECETASESTSSSVEHGILEDRLKPGLVDLSKHVTCSSSNAREALEQGTYACGTSSFRAGNVVPNENGNSVGPGLVLYTEQEGFFECPQNFPPSTAVHSNLIPYIPQQNIGTPFLPARSSRPFLAGYSPPCQRTYRAPVAMMPSSTAGKQVSSFPAGISLCADTSRSLKSPLTEISSLSLNPTHLPRATEGATSNPCVYHYADISLPSVDMYNSLYPIQPSPEPGIVSFRSSGRSTGNAKEVSSDETLKDQQARKTTQINAVHKEKTEIITTAAIACPRLESMQVGAMVDGLGSPRSDLLSGDFGSHLSNLAYGRWCQDAVLHGSILPFTVFTPQRAQEQGLWEGPGRPFHSNMNVPTNMHGHGLVSGYPFFNASGYLGTNSAILPGTFTGEELPKPRSGTGTYFPNLSHRSYRERFLPNKGRHQQGAPSHDFIAREGTSTHQSNSRYDSVPHWQTGYTDVGANTADGKFGGSDISRQETPHRRSHQPTSAGAMGDTVLALAGSMTPGMYSSSHITGNETPSAFTAVSPSGPPVVMLYPYSNGLIFPSGQLEFGSFGPVQFSAIPRVRSGKGGPIGSGALNDQSCTSGSVASLSFSSEKGLQQPATPSQQEREAPHSYQLKEEDFPPLSFQGHHRGSSTAAGNDHGHSDRRSNCQSYIAASTF